jgi:hypothetical protein
MTNTTYTDFPFTAEGINFISRIYDNSPFLAQIKTLPAGAFEQINASAVADLMNLKTYTLEEIQNELDRVNEGGTHSFILLGDNN